MRKEKTQMVTNIPFARGSVMILLNGNMIEKNLSIEIADKERMEQATERLNMTMLPMQ